MFNFIYVLCAILLFIFFRCWGLYNSSRDSFTLLFKEKPENVLIWGQDQKDYPMSIKTKQGIFSMDTDIFQVFVEETHIFECDNFLKLFVGYWHVFMSWIWPTPKRGKNIHICTEHYDWLERQWRSS